MGLFHCPVGALFRDDEPCVDCGLCEAKTKEEMVEASRKIREYLRSHAQRADAVKKIAVCGKGGSGKSTIVALMVNVLSEEGYTVVALDTDESNPGLCRMLGFPKEPKPLMKLLKRFSYDEPVDPENWLTKDEISSSDIPGEFLSEHGNIRFLMMGKILDPFEGCACRLADLSKNFLGKLVVEEKEKVVVDMEAGIESFGRGVERNVDTVLMIVEPTFESMALAERINYMAEGIGINTVRAILNKIPSEEIERRVKDRLKTANIESVGSVYYDLRVNEDAFDGRALGESQAKEEVRLIVRRLLNLSSD
jgi:CO dehydrogenase maturation factor